MNSSTENKTLETQCEFDRNIQALRKVPLFSALPMETLKALAFFCRRSHYRKDQDLCIQGESDNQAYLLLEGTVQVLLECDGSVDVVGEFGPDAFVGGLALLTDARRLFTLRAAGDVRCIVLPRKKVMASISQSPEAAEKFLAAISRSIIEWEERLLKQTPCGKRTLKDVGVSLI